MSLSSRDLQYLQIAEPVVLVFRALQVGDMLCAIPALRVLRRRLPWARIILISLPWAVQLLPRFEHLIDQVMPFPGYPGLPEQLPDPAKLPEFLKQVRGMKADLAIQLHGSGEISNTIVESFQPLSTVTCSRTNDTSRLPWPEHGHEIHRCLAIVSALGAEIQDDTLEFPIMPADIAELATTGLPDRLASADYVCLHPGARSADKQWPVACYADVGDALADQGLKVVLTGSASEWGLAEQVRQQMRQPALNAASAWSLGAMAALMRDAKLLICNDSGVSHLASALRLPSVVVFINTNPQRWAPLDRKRHRVVLDPAGSCTEVVLSAAQQLLEQAHADSE